MLEKNKLVFCAFVISTALMPIGALAEKWVVVDETTPGQQRSIDLDSIKFSGGIANYQFRVHLSTAGKFFERPVVTDCAQQSRFEVRHPDDWDRKPFEPIYSDSWQAKEYILVCRQVITRGPDPRKASQTAGAPRRPEPAPPQQSGAISQTAQSETANASGLAVAQQGKRIALVIGNANYAIRPLKNPINDANDISAALKLSGFSVIELRDANLPQMRQAVRAFGDALLSSDVGLVYYSGHGVEVRGKNYFIPVNADIQREDEIADQGLDVSLILEKMSTAKRSTNILIVDACRDDPFGRSFRSSSTGLASMEAPRGTIIAYATSPGKVAADGVGRNSPYTRHLLRAMQTPNRPIELVFKEVRRAVQIETQDRQTPWENTSLSGDFYFRIQR